MEERSLDEYMEAIEIVKEFIGKTGIDPFANEKFLKSERLNLGRYEIHKL